MRLPWNYHKPNRWRGLVLGVIGSVAGIAAMRMYWQVAAALEGEDPRSKEKQEPTPEPLDALDSVSLIGRHYQSGESSTAAMGRIAYRAITGKEPQSQETKTLLSYVVHWLISLGAGGLYGLVREDHGVSDLAGGAIMGTGLWLLGDELMMPVLGLTEGPTSYPTEVHLHSWGAHIAFGVASAVAAQALDALVEEIDL